MKLRYKHQRFQTEAALAVVNAFTGQPKSDGQSDHIVDQGVHQDLFVVKGFGNKNVILAPEAVCENVRAIQTEQGLKPVEQLQQLLGHKRIDTTLQYAMVKQSNVKLAHRKYIG